MSGPGLPILAYHALDGSGSVTATDPAWFAHTLRSLREAGFRAIDLAAWIADGRPALERAFALTFDDGLASIRLAAAQLDEYGWTATAFLVTGRMGLDNAWPGQPKGIPRERLLAWSELDDLGRAGVRFGAHTRTHPRLDRLAPDAIERELSGSRRDIEDQVGQPCPLLAYPYGVETPPIREAAARHFDGAFGTRLNYADVEQDAFALSRIDAFYLRSAQALGALISGRWRAKLRARRALRAARRMLLNGLLRGFDARG